MAGSKKTEMIKGLPILPLRDVIIYPTMVAPLFVGRSKSINALDDAAHKDSRVMLVTQHNAEIEEPGPTDIYHVGTLGTVLQLLKLPDGTTKALIEGTGRAKIKSCYVDKDVLRADVTVIAQTCAEEPKKIDAMAQFILEQFNKYAKASKRVSADVLHTLGSIEEPGRLADNIANHLSLDIPTKQDLLETHDEFQRMEKLANFINEEMSVLEIGKEIRGQVQKQMEKSQREYYLNEQMKAIQQELNGESEGQDESEEYKSKIDQAKMPKDANKKANSELSKLGMMASMSAEATVVRNYLDWLVDIPWSKKSRIKKDLNAAQKSLDCDHYGLEKVKERILEYLAVQQKAKSIKSPILCFVGPPGVGKTSLGKSIANATGRKFTRMALGGVRDEAEIRGHRRTYIGALPGKFIQNIAKVGVRNPLFLLDEVDKMSMDFRGDPASALLEVLDPEQNHTFSDHYLELDFDLSDVMFVCTANSLNIPSALLDRMEVIRLPGYTEDEKTNIATNYLVPKKIKDNGLDHKEIKFTAESIRHMIQYYTREAGVRGLERNISKVCRKVVKAILMNKGKKPGLTHIKTQSLEKYLGVRKYRYDIVDDKNRVGQVNGLAWTESGGDLLTVEATMVSGKGKLIQTGQLGDVMQESGQAAMTVVRSRVAMFNADNKFHENNDIHVHVPEGATPKDGPSAGVAMCTAIISALTNTPVKSSVAMTGEITLRGEVLAIGGLKEKLLAAMRSQIKTVLIPAENEKDLKEMPANITSKLNIIPVKWIDEVIEQALVEVPLAEDFLQSKDATRAGTKNQKGPNKPTKSGRVSRH